jgi:predicted DNA-binding transcriptional regulator YafY
LASGKRESKTDRLARFLDVLYLLSENPAGLYPEELAKKCRVSVRTTYRDLKALSGEMEIPLKSEKGRWKIPSTHLLPSINLSLPEVTNIFFAARLLLGYSNSYNSSIATTLMKLKSIAPHPLKEQIHKTIEWMQRCKKDSSPVLGLLAQAWMSGTRAKIQYLVQGRETLSECVIEPYFIQTTDIKVASHIIAYCPDTGSIYTFEIERIKSLKLLNERYTTPRAFDAQERINKSHDLSKESNGRDAKERKS